MLKFHVEKDTFMKIGVVVVILGIIAAAIAATGMEYNHRETYVITITSLDRVTTSSTNSDGVTTTSSKWMVLGVTDAGEAVALENTDEMVFGKYNSSNIQAMFIIGQKYKIDTYGYRRPFWSQYPNILSVTKVE